MTIKKALHLLILFAFISRVFASDAMALSMVTSAAEQQTAITRLIDQTSSHSQQTNRTISAHCEQLLKKASSPSNSDIQSKNNTACADCCLSVFVNTSHPIIVSRFIDGHIAADITALISADLSKVVKPPVF